MKTVIKVNYINTNPFWISIFINNLDHVIAPHSIFAISTKICII